MSKDMEVIRQKFEQWAKGERYSLDCKLFMGGVIRQYTSIVTQNAWVGWKAAMESWELRDAEVAELQEQFDVAVSRVSRLEKQVAALMAALTPSATTKGCYIGEFHFHIDLLDEDGIEYAHKVTVPWTTTKEIMAMIKSHAEKLNTETA